MFPSVGPVDGPVGISGGTDSIQLVTMLTLLRERFSHSRHHSRGKRTRLLSGRGAISENPKSLSPCAETGLRLGPAVV